MTNTEEQVYYGLGLDVREQDLQRVDRLRLKLGAKAKQEPKFRFYSLYGHIYRMDILRKALESVVRNKGAPGVDGMSTEALRNPEAARKFLDTIQTELKDRTYRPQPVRRVYIPKANGKLRPLGIPTVKDRVVQQATLMILEPIFEEDFLECSHGFRPRRSAKGALEQIGEAIRQGKCQALDADLKGYFDNIPHDKLMACVRTRVSDRNVLNLIKMWLKCPIIEEDKSDGRKIKIFPTKGTPQGGVISPLLANLFLHFFDKVFHSKNGPFKWANARLVRYADDFVILARYCGFRIIEFTQNFIEERMGLEINLEKTKIIDLYKGDRLDFLGYSFQYRNSQFGFNKKYLELAPSEKAIKREKEAIKEMTHRRFSWKPIDQFINDVNKQVGGWGNYYSLGYCKKARRKINWYLEYKIRKHLERRSQRRFKPPKGMSFYTFLYKKCGLVQL